MTLLEKLQYIQSNLKAPKNQYNSFGKYHYRSCEDIQEGVKPLLKETKTVLTISDEIVQIGGRYYVKATAKLLDCESNQTIENVAYAREEESKKGMDASQVTGATSSYARKYALNGLFCIDDNKDADSMDNTNEKVKTITQKEADVLKELVKKKGLDINKVFNVPVEQLTKEQYVAALKKLEKTGLK